MKTHYKVISWAAILPPFFSRYKGHDGNLVIDQLVDEAAVRTKKNVSGVWNSDCSNPISHGDVLFLFFGPWFLDQHPDLHSQLWYFLALHTQSIIVLLHSFSLMVIWMANPPHPLQLHGQTKSLLWQLYFSGGLTLSR